MTTIDAKNKTTTELAIWLEGLSTGDTVYYTEYPNFDEAAKRLRTQEARIAELTKDAERYRWLRNQHDIHDPLARVVWWNQPTGMLTFTWIETVNSKNLDESIDAAKEQV